MDGRFHTAKLTAVAMSEKPSAIWEEHEAFRREALSTPAPARPAPTFDDVARIHRMMQDAGLIPPTSEAN